MPFDVEVSVQDVPVTGVVFRFDQVPVVER